MKRLALLVTLVCACSFGQELVDVDVAKFPPKIVKSASATQIQLPGAPTTADATADSIFSAEAADKTPLMIQGAAGQTAPLQEFQKSDGAVWSYVDAVGGFYGGADFITTAVGSNYRCNAGSGVSWHASGSSGAVDLGLARASAGVVKVSAGSTGLGAITASKVETSTANTSALATMSISEELTCATGAVTFTTTADLLPANSFIIGVSARVTQAPADAVTWGMGVSGTLEKFAENLQPKTLGQMTSSWATGHAAGTGGPTTMLAPFVQAAAAKVVVTFSGDPGATSAKIRITVFYQTLTPPGS